MRFPVVLLALCALCGAADTPQDLAERGAALKAKGDAAGALELFRQAADLDPQSARLQDEIGFLLAVLNRRTEAIQSFQHALDLDAKFAPAQYHLGVVYWLESNPALSVPHLQSAVALDPGNFEYQYRLGEALKSQGDYAGALPHLKAAVAADEKHADTWNSLGMALQNTGARVFAGRGRMADTWAPGSTRYSAPASRNGAAR